MNRTRLGSFKEAAKVLTELSGFTWSRQRVNQYWKRQQKGDVNGFPDFHIYSINGHEHSLLDMVDIADWYGFVEAANHLTVLSGKLWTPSQVYKLHQESLAMGYVANPRFPRRIWIDADATDIETRIAFNLDELTSYWETRGLDG